MSFLPERNVTQLPMVFILDGSSVMSELNSSGISKRRIQNSALKAIERFYKQDVTARQSIDIKILLVKDSDFNVIQDWIVFEEFQPKKINNTSGNYILTDALLNGFKSIKQRHEYYLKNNIGYSMGQIFVFSGDTVKDSATQWSQVIKLKDRIKRSEMDIYHIHIAEEDSENIISDLTSNGKTFRLDSSNFNDIFEYINVPIKYSEYYDLVTSRERYNIPAIDLFE